MPSLRLAAALVPTLALALAACAVDTEEAPVDAQTLEPSAFADTMVPAPLPDALPPHARPDTLGPAEPEVDLERAVATGLEVRTLTHAILRRTAGVRRTEPHDVEEPVDEYGLRGRVHSASDGELRVARFWLEGRVNEHPVTVELGFSDWGTGSMVDGTVTHRDMTLELYSIHQRDDDGTARWGFEDAWTVAGDRYELVDGRVVLAASELTAEGDLLHAGEVVGGLVVTPEAVVLTTPQGDIELMSR